MYKSYPAGDTHMVSPCHPRFGCPNIGEDKTFCSHKCKPLAAYRKLLDATAVTRIGNIDFNSDTYSCGNGSKMYDWKKQNLDALALGKEIDSNTASEAKDVSA